VVANAVTLDSFMMLRRCGLCSLKSLMNGRGRDGRFRSGALLLGVESDWERIGGIWFWRMMKKGAFFTPHLALYYRALALTSIFT